MAALLSPEAEGLVSPPTEPLRNTSDAVGTPAPPLAGSTGQPDGYVPLSSSFVQRLRAHAPASPPPPSTLWPPSVHVPGDTRPTCLEALLAALHACSANEGPPAQQVPADSMLLVRTLESELRRAVSIGSPEAAGIARALEVERRTRCYARGSPVAIDALASAMAPSAPVQRADPSVAAAPDALTSTQIAELADIKSGLAPAQVSAFLRSFETVITDISSCHTELAIFRMTAEEWAQVAAGPAMQAASRRLARKLRLCMTLTRPTDDGDSDAPPHLGRLTF